MATSDPSPPDPKSILTSLIDAFNGLDPVLRYGGLITVVGVVILWLTGVFPEIFLIYPALALVAYLVYALYNRHLDYRDRQLEYGHKLEELKEKHRHKEATSRSNREESQEPVDEKITPPSTGNEMISALQKHAVVDHEILIGVDELLTRIREYLLDPGGSWIISLFGQGGLGKTALAYEAVKQYAGQAGFTRFAWVSAKQRYYSSRGELQSRDDVKLQWADLVREAADQLRFEMGYSRTEWLNDFEKGIRQLPPNEKCLIVIDNLETVEDIEVVEYLDDPHHSQKGVIKPHKIIITTRKSIQEHSYNVREIPLQGLKSNSTYELIRLLGRGNRDIEEADSEKLRPIFEATEGNPLLIKLIVSRFLFSRKPLGVILKELKEKGQLKEFLYLQSVRELEQRFNGDVSKQLMTAFCFSIAGEALTYDKLFHDSGISDEKLFGEVLKFACDLSLIRVSGLDTRYSIHSLLWEFICRED